MIRIRFLHAMILMSWLAATRGIGHETPPHLEGTFVQLWQAHKGWSAQDWDKLFEYFRRLRLSRLVIQWSAYNDLRYYPTEGKSAGAKSTAVEGLLDRADAAGMKVLVGLSYNSGYWQAIKNEPPLVRLFLRRLQLQSETTARELLPLVSRHPSFIGWYVCEEVDDISWNEPQRRELIVEYLQNLSRSLSKLSPGTKVALSGFSNARLSAESLADFWGRIFKSAGLDLLFFQDGIGTGKIPLQELAAYLSALRSVAERHHRDLCVTVETFLQESGDSPGTTFRAVPAPLDRLQRQLEIGSRFSQCGLVGFSVPEYLSPAGGSAAAALYESYCKALGF